MVRTERHYRPNRVLEAHYAGDYALYRDIADAMRRSGGRLSAMQAITAGVAA